MSNGHDTYSSSALKSSDFNKLSSRVEETDFSSSSYTVSQSRDLYSDIKDSHYKSSKPVNVRRESKFGTKSNESDLGSAKLATSLRDDSKSFKMDAAKDFGTYSSLLAPALIAGRSMDNLASTSR